MRSLIVQGSPPNPEFFLQRNTHPPDFPVPRTAQDHDGQNRPDSVAFQQEGFIPMNHTTSKILRKLSITLIAGAFLFGSVSACSFFQDESDDDNTGIFLLGGAAALLGVLSSSSATANQSGMVVDVPKGVATQ